MAPPRNMFALVVLAASACHSHGRRRDALAVPRTTGAMTIDGEWTEPDWSKHALRGQFLGSDHRLSRPTSEVRFLRDDATLYIGLYAADDDIRSTDAFDVALGSLALHVDALGHITPNVTGARAAVDRDGTLDDANNFDEEWLIELAIPIAALPSHGPTAVMASRCDTPKHQAQICTSWSGTVALP